MDVRHVDSFATDQEYDMANIDQSLRDQPLMAPLMNDGIDATSAIADIKGASSTYEESDE